VSTISQTTQLPTKVSLAPYQVVHKIAKSKKRHTIGEKLILPATIDHCKYVDIGAAQQLKMLPLSNYLLEKRYMMLPSN